MHKICGDHQIFPSHPIPSFLGQALASARHHAMSGASLQADVCGLFQILGHQPGRLGQCVDTMNCSYSMAII